MLDILNHKGPVGIPSAVLIELMSEVENATDLGPQPPLWLRLRQRPILPVTSVRVDPHTCYGQPASDSPAPPPASG